MYAKELAINLHEALALHGTYQETERRFESLRGYGRLPTGRENAAQRLTNEQIANAVLGFVPSVPDWAGHVSLILSDLRCVGGTNASVGNCETLNCLIASLIGVKQLTDSVRSVLLGIPIDTSTGHYFARAYFNEAASRKEASFVSKMAVSLLNNGAEETFDAQSFMEGPMRFLSLDRNFFKDLSRDIELSRLLNRPLKTDWREYTSEEERSAFYKKLGAKSSSNFLNIGVETTVTWPKEPCRISFEGHNLVLFPKTKEHSHSISIDLLHERLDADRATTIANRFLTMLAWCDDRHAVLLDGRSGGRIPSPVPRQNLGFHTAPIWPFNRELPANEDLLQRLAYYREGLNALHSRLTSFAVLSFYKVFEVRQSSKRGDPNLTKTWLKENFEKATETADIGELKAFNDERGSKAADEYIMEDCRVATAHASAKHPSDADAAPELRRLHLGAIILKRLARYKIRSGYGFSESIFESRGNGVGPICQ